MESDILKHFVNREVEVLVGGVWIEGFMLPIAKGVVVLNPVGDMTQFYGPCSFKAEAIMAIRQVRRSVAVPPVEPVPPSTIKSSFESVSPQRRFAKK